QTVPAQIRLIELQVDPHLVLHFTLEVSAPAADSKPRLHARDQTHTSSGTASSANPIASEPRRQYAVSSLSRRRPAVVRREYFAFRLFSESPPSEMMSA